MEQVKDSLVAPVEVDWAAMHAGWMHKVDAHKRDTIERHHHFGKRKHVHCTVSMRGQANTPVRKKKARHTKADVADVDSKRGQQA